MWQPGQAHVAQLDLSMVLFALTQASFVLRPARSVVSGQRGCTDDSGPRITFRNSSRRMGCSRPRIRKTSSFPGFRDRRSWSCGSANIMRPPGRKSPGPLGGENAHGREQNGRPPAPNKGGNAAVRHWTCPSPILVNCCLVPSDDLTVLLAMSRSGTDGR